MKSLINLICGLTFCIHLNAQTNITLQINHLLDGAEFEKNINTVNNIGNNYNINRLEYYLSGFSITHDGGQRTEIEDLYAFVSLLSKSDPKIIELGSFEIGELESINFYFGVDEEANHADPTLYDPSHPLAPKFPSMHWGWAGGYRFIALEGKSGPNYNQDLQFHCIGDEFWQEISIPASTSDDDTQTIILDAEYSELLHNINMNSGLIIHGGTDEIIDLSQNFIDRVFTLSNVVSSTENSSWPVFDIYPNPVTSGHLNITSEQNLSEYSAFLRNSNGKKIRHLELNHNQNIFVEEKGIYYLSITDSSGKVISTKKVLFQ